MDPAVCSAVKMCTRVKLDVEGFNVKLIQIKKKNKNKNPLDDFRVMEKYFCKSSSLWDSFLGSHLENQKAI